MKVGVAGALLAWALAGCVPSADQNEQVAIGNAIDADANIVDDADERADRLDEKSEELLKQAKAEGKKGAALHAEGQADLNEAAAIRKEGQEDGADASDRIEQKEGFLNKQ